MSRVWRGVQKRVWRGRRQKERVRFGRRSAVWRGMQKRVWCGRRQKERVKFGKEECGVAWRAAVVLVIYM